MSAPPRVHNIAPGLDVIESATNVGVLRRNGRVLLFNCLQPDGLVSAGVAPGDVDWVLATHHHRSALRGARELAFEGIQVAVPASERLLIEDADTYWSNDELYRVHGYNYHPSPKTVRESVPVARGLEDGDRLDWQDVTVRAIETPGPSSGGMTYLVQLEGETIAFTGDLISGPGQLHEFYSLQGRRELPDGNLAWEYHGFGERSADVLRSLDRVIGEGATLLVPSHGKPMHHPRKAVNALRKNIDACMTNYCTISAAQWYFAGSRLEWPADVEWMKSRLRPLPDWVREVGGTTRALVADTGETLLMDAASNVHEQIREQQNAGDLGPAEGIWVTHYHDDHVGSLNVLRDQQDCPTIAHESMVDILRRPNAYLMPCLDPEPVVVDRVTRDGESWQWNGIRLTAFTMPGQTLLDAALLAEVGEERVLFVGDSLGPGGIDDYCAQNRNLLGPGLGHDRCLELVESLPEGCLLVNPHVAGAFVFSRDELRGMRDALAERRKLFARLIYWDDPNYGLDAGWVRCDPYYQPAKPGDTVEWTVHVRNHSDAPRSAIVGLRAPDGWGAEVSEAEVQIPPGETRGATLSATAPADATGREVVGFAVRYGDRDLGEMTEGVVDLMP